MHCPQGHQGKLMDHELGPQTTGLAGRDSLCFSDFFFQIRYFSNFQYNIYYKFVIYDQWYYAIYFVICQIMIK